MSIFKRKPNDLQLVTEFGQMAAEFENLAQLDDLMCASKGAIYIHSILVAAKDTYGIRLNPEASFAGFMELVGRQDVVGMTAAIRNYAAVLRRKNTPQARGSLIYFWVSKVATGY